MKLRLLLLVAALGWLNQPVQAGQPRAFSACAPCYGELKHIKKVAQEGRALDVVLVSTDTPDRGAVIENTLAEYGLDNFESWVFNDPIPERLRFKVDPQWFGELPRAYFYDYKHSRTAYSGAISLHDLRRMAGEPGENI